MGKRINMLEVALKITIYGANVSLYAEIYLNKIFSVTLSKYCIGMKFVGASP